MVISYCKLYLHADWVHSLKEKRMIVKSLIDKLKNRFNASVSEIENQDLHKTITIGIVICGSDANYLSGVMDKIIDFVESNTEAYIEDIINGTIHV